MATLRARLTAGPDAVARAIALSRRFAQASDLPAPVADQLAIVVEEWVINLVEHAALPPGSGVALSFQRANRCVRLEVTDAGQPFDPRTVEFEGPNLERGGGAGLAMMKAWCRIADYRRAGGRNRLVLELPV